LFEIFFPPDLVSKSPISGGILIDLSTEKKLPLTDKRWQYNILTQWKIPF
jgi:hypothetical protein